MVFGGHKDPLLCRRGSSSDGTQFYFIVVPRQIIDTFDSGNRQDRQTSQTSCKNAENCSQVIFSVCGFIDVMATNGHCDVVIMTREALSFNRKFGLFMRIHLVAVW